MSIIQDEIDHLSGVLAGLTSDNPAWEATQIRIMALRAEARRIVETVKALPEKPLVPVNVKEQMDADLAALEKLASDGA